VVDLLDDDEDDDLAPQCSHLVLPHVPDVFVGGGGDAEAPLKVLCLDISPSGNVLVTGCEDGVARVWRFGDQDGVFVNKTAAGGAVAHSTRATAGAHKMRPMESALQSLESLVSAEEFTKMSLVARHMLQRLEGHVSPVTDIRLSAQGDRLVTGSAQDGSVRIWSLSRDYLKCTHIVLNLAEEDDEVAQSFQTRVRGKNVRGNKSQVYNVGWTADDLRVVTIQSVPSRPNLTHVGSGPPKLMTRLKVWDSTTGDLLRVIWSVSSSPCSVLLLHPLDPQIALTAGEDGLVNVWNLDLECIVSRCSLLYDDGTPAHVVDASYSPDGTRVVATDMIGRVTYLSLDDPARYKGSVLTEQYFSTDYANILLDDDGFAIDEGTQLPVQEAPVGLLCRLDGSAYETQPSASSFATYPPPLSDREVRARLDAVIDLREQLGRTMDRAFAVFSRNKNRGRAPKRYRNSKTSRPRSEQMGGFSSSPATQSRYKEFDLSQYQPSSDDSALDSDWDRAADEQERRRMHSSSAGPATSRVRSSRVASNSQRRGGNIHDLRSVRTSGSHRSSGDGFGSNVHSFSSLRRSSRSRGGSNLSSHSDLYDDEDDDDNRGASRGSSSGRAQRAAQRSEKRSRLATVRDQDEDEDSGDTEELLDEDAAGSSTDSELGEERAHPTRRSQRQKKRPSHGNGSSSSRNSSRRDVVVRSDDDEEEEIGHTESNSYVPVRRAVKLAWRGSTSKNGLHTLPQGAIVDRQWVLGDTVSEAQYSPQVGDKVVYLPQGHLELLSAFPESSSPPWLSFPSKWPLVECEVRAVQYRLPSEQELKFCPSVIVRLTLSILRVPIRNQFQSSGLYYLELAEAARATRNSTHKEHTFTVSLRSCHVPEFVIPSHLFLRSVRNPWVEGMRIDVQYKERCGETGEVTFKPYSGTVTALVNRAQEWPGSPWEALEVRWDETETGELSVDRIGLWEATPQFEADTPYQQARDKFISPLLPVETCERIAVEVGALMEQGGAAFAQFMHDVDRQAFEQYYCIIAAPMCVDLILRRLRGGYYRQVGFD
jgi:WD40 repeat protein